MHAIQRHSSFHNKLATQEILIFNTFVYSKYICVAQHQRMHSHRHRNKCCKKLKEMKIGISVEKLWKFPMIPVRTRYKPHNSHSRQWFNVPIHPTPFPACPWYKRCHVSPNLCCRSGMFCWQEKNIAYIAQPIWRGNMVLGLVWWPEGLGLQAVYPIGACSTLYIMSVRLQIMCTGWKTHLTTSSYSWGIRYVQVNVASLPKTPSLGPKKFTA
jgi:hypothetical protein